MLKQISLRNFRNHLDFDVEIPKNGLLITGPNGSGKTSLLEAIFTLGTTRSFRSRNMAAVISHGADIGEVRAVTDAEELIFRWQIHPTKKTVLERNRVRSSAPEILRKKSFFVVLFSPEELLLPFASPGERRKFLNRLLLPLFPNHFHALREFEKVLRSRNALLKRIQEGLAQPDELEFYDEKLAEVSSQITSQRQQFFESTAQQISQLYQEISGKSEQLAVKFLPDINDQDPLKIIRQEYPRDLARGISGRGAHHDDFRFWLGPDPLEESGSRGEVRSAILALKIAEKEYIQNLTGREPILLLDDVFSELDSERRRHLAEMVKNSQAIITATDVPSRAFENVSLKVLTLE